MARSHPEKILYSCSGCSSSAQMANWIAIQLDRKGLAEMSCIAGVGGGVKPLLEEARAAESIIGLDGCPLHCAEHCLKREGLKSAVHFDLSKFGVIKKNHQDFDPKEAERVLYLIIRKLQPLSEAPEVCCGRTGNGLPKH